MSPAEIDRRNFIAKTIVGGAAGAFVGAKQSSVRAEPTLPPDIDPDSPLARFWQKQVAEVVAVDLTAAAPELAKESIKERHRIYCFLLMALVRRFWNGNNNGPLGIYPWRERQKESGQDPHATIFRYRGDIAKDSDRFRINWDRYLGHNIACVAVDGNGEVIDFDFNHNNVFRSSAEHAEARMVRRLFSLAQIFDKWRTGTLIPGKSRGFSLQDVTIYTSLESCAQCSGVMSLGRVRQVVYLQHDPGAYRVGNIMFNLAGRDPGDNASALAPIPVDASVLGVRQVGELDLRYLEFRGKISTAGRQKDKKLAYFIPPDGSDPDYAPSITSFLCTDNAYAVFDRGADEFTRLTLQYPTERGPHSPSGWTNQECLAEARRFFQYADVEGFRGTPHKL